MVKIVRLYQSTKYMDKKIIKQLKDVLKQELANVATKADLMSFATKNDLITLKKGIKSDAITVAGVLKKEFKHDLDEAIGQIIRSTDKSKVDKETVSELEDRIERVENKLAD